MEMHLLSVLGTIFFSFFGTICITKRHIHVVEFWRLGSLRSSEGELLWFNYTKYKQADLFLSKGNPTTDFSGSVGFSTSLAGDLMSS